jgi:hypothetical protein
MAEDRTDGQLPASAEAIHLPGPSYLPAAIALFTTIALVGVVVNWVVFGIAMAVIVVCILRWIGDTRRDIAELPLDH